MLVLIFLIKKRYSFSIFLCLYLHRFVLVLSLRSVALVSDPVPVCGSSRILLGTRGGAFERGLSFKGTTSPLCTLARPEHEVLVGDRPPVWVREWAGAHSLFGVIGMQGKQPANLVIQLPREDCN